MVTDLEGRGVDVQLVLGNLTSEEHVQALVAAHRERYGRLDVLVTCKKHRSAWVVNLASMAAITGQPWLSVYAATKGAVLSFTRSMNRELGPLGVKSCAICPSVVDTPFTDFLKGSVPAETMLRPDDVAEVVRMLLRLSPNCEVPEVMLQRPGDDPFA